MGERRKRKSLWDMEEESKHFSGMSEHDSWTGNDHRSGHDSGSYHEFSASRTTVKSKDHSGRTSWEPVEENQIASINISFRESRHSAREGKEMGEGKAYYQNMSPGFDGKELYEHNHLHEYDQGHSRRYLRRSRSRSRSRSRTRGRSRSRSLNRDRGRGWSSRSRSRSNDNSRKDDARSRSPIGDYRCQSYGWSDRRSGPDKSSQISRDFDAGRSRRGSPCRFSHPNSRTHRDGEFREDDAAESWRNRMDYSRTADRSNSRHSGFESRPDVSDSYHGHDDQFLNRSRSAVPCKDFMRGNCRWGDTCRFSHHASSDDSSGKGTRTHSFHRNIESQPHKNSRPFCKFFAAGKCTRDNCRFSHDDQNLNNIEGRQEEVTYNRSFQKISNSWNNQASDDVTRISGTLEPTGFDETVVISKHSTGGTSYRKNANRGYHMLENENSSWSIPEGTGNFLNLEKQPALPRENVGYGVEDSSEPITKDNMADKQKHLKLHDLQLQDRDGIANVPGLLLESQRFSIKALPQNVYPASDIHQQLNRGAENDLMNSFGPDVRDDVDTRYTNTPNLFSGQTLNQNGGSMFLGHSSVSNENDGVHNVLRPDPSDGFSSDLNGTVTQIVIPLDSQSGTQNYQEAVQTPKMIEPRARLSLPNLSTNTHSAEVLNFPVATVGQQIFPVTSSTVFLAQRFESEKSQADAGIEVPTSREEMPSFSDASVSAALVNTTNVQLAVSRDLVKTMEKNRESIEQGNHNVTHGTEENNQIQMERASALHTVAAEVDTSKLKHPESPKLRQEEVVANSEVPSEVTGGNKAIDKEGKGGHENKPAGTQDGQGKLEDGSANKDEKGIRIFKNALVEFVKEILKPTWKEGRMSREVHKTVVKKVVDKVACTIQVENIPKTQDKVEQYLSHAKPKITKLVQAYVVRFQKADS